MWLHEAIATSYLPVLDVLARLAEKGHRNLATVGITPVLAAQLDDPECLQTTRSWAADWLMAHQELGQYDRPAAARRPSRRTRLCTLCRPRTGPGCPRPGDAWPTPESWSCSAAGCHPSSHCSTTAPPRSACSRAWTTTWPVSAAGQPGSGPGVRLPAGPGKDLRRTGDHAFPDGRADDVASATRRTAPGPWGHRRDGVRA